MTEPTPAPERRRCLVVEDHPATRAWLAEAVTAAFPGMAVVAVASLAEARACLDAAAKPPRGDFAFALVDLGLPDGSGIELIRRLADRHPDTVPVVATIYDDDDHLFRAIAAGARGYLLKGDDGDMLVAYLRRIGHGEPPLSPAIAERILAHFRRPARVADGLSLTPRERETLALIGRGLTVAETAAELGLSPTTVASYLKVVYDKLNISSRAEAAREAMRRGLL